MSVRLADGSAICAGCYQQRPELKYVDFDANWDGPAFTDENGYPKNQVDDLILCEACVLSAASVVKANPQREADLEREVSALKRDLREAWDHIDTMEEAIPRRPGRPSKQKLGV